MGTTLAAIDRRCVFATRGRRRRAPVALLCAAPFMTVLDANLVAIALPSIRAELGFSRIGLQWVVGAYSLAFGAALLIAGRAADLYGRRRLLVLGLALFTAASLTAALAPDRPLLLAARAAQGLGAALALPASLALISALSEPGDARNRALGLYGAFASAAFLSGMVLGGLLTALLGWRSTLLVNCPIGTVAAAATLRLVPDPRARRGRRALALPGALAAGAGISALLYALGEAARPGSRPGSTVVPLASAVLLIALAVQLERRAPAPLVPPALLRRVEVRIAVVGALLTVGTGVGVVFVLTLYLQGVLGHDPVAAGLVLTPLGVAGVSAGLLAPGVARRAGLARTLAAALVVQAAGVALLTRIGAADGLALVLAGTAALGLGHFAATVAFTALATVRGTDAQHGVAMGLIGSAQQIGGALGLAVLAAVATARTASAGAGPPTAEAVVEGFRWALAAGAGMSLAGAALVLAVSARRRPAAGRPPPRGWRTTRPRARSSRR